MLELFDKTEGIFNTISVVAAFLAVVALAVCALIYACGNQKDSETAIKKIKIMFVALIVLELLPIIVLFAAQTAMKYGWHPA